MSPGRLLLFGFLLVAGVAALSQYLESAGRPPRQRLTESFRNAALTALIFGAITMMVAAVVIPTVGAVAGIFGYGRGRGQDARQHHALPNAKRALPRGLKQGEPYVIAAAPLLFFAWAWTRKSEAIGVAPGGQRMVGTPSEAVKAVTPAPAPAMTRGQAMEFWFWCWAAAAERERYDPGYPAPVVRWRVSACLRIQAAFERLHGDARGSSDALEDRLARGLDPVGVALFNRYLLQQRQLWSEREIAGSEEDREEAATRASVVESASRAFHRSVGATSRAIERGAASLPVATDARRLEAGLRMGGVVIYDEATEGPIPAEEEGPRWTEAIRRINAAGWELKS